MTDWYEQHIEAPLRGIVRHLRENGINTAISCAHEMYIKCYSSSQYTIDTIADLLLDYMKKEYGEERANFDVETRCEAHFGRVSYPLIEIRLYLIKEQRAYLLKEKRRLTRKGVKQMTPRQIRGLPRETREQLFRVNKLLHEMDEVKK
jgi:hypothetical protein